MYTEEVNKIALSSNDDKRIQTVDKVTTYPYGTNVFVVFKNEMLFKNKITCDQVKHRLETDDYLSALMDSSKNLRRLNLKSKSNIVSGIIANAKKDKESLKTEINDVKKDHAMSKRDLNSLNNEISEYLKESLKVTDSVIEINNDILVTKNEYYVNIKNWCHIIKNDTLITKTNCIKLKSMI